MGFDGVEISTKEEQTNKQTNSKTDNVRRQASLGSKTERCPAILVNCVQPSAILNRELHCLDRTLCVPKPRQEDNGTESMNAGKVGEEK